MIKLICVGKVKEAYIKEGINEFVKRLTAFSKFEIIELKDSNPEKEGKEIMNKIDNGKVFLLDEKGKEFSSGDFSELLNKEVMNNKNLIFVIGGPNGLDSELKKKYQSIALSRMTFTHEMARLFFIEQLYRAFMINNNRSYHR